MQCRKMVRHFKNPAAFTDHFTTLRSKGLIMHIKQICYIAMKFSFVYTWLSIMCYSKRNKHIFFRNIMIERIWTCKSGNIVMKRWVYISALDLRALRSFRILIRNTVNECQFRNRLYLEFLPHWSSGLIQLCF